MMNSTFFILGIIVTVSFSIPFFVETKLWKNVIFILSIIFAIIVALTSQQYTSTKTHILLSLSIFSLPMLISLSIQHYKSKRSELSDNEMESMINELASKPEIEIVQEIDNMLNCLIGVNNEWIKSNWASKADEEKMNFITTHRKTLNENLIYVQDASELIELMQKVERGLIINK